MLEALGQKPLLDLGQHLGDGTGAAFGFALLDAVARIYNDMATFESAGSFVAIKPTPERARQRPGYLP
jgi:nicotinate-nucleotide--dimethylbenzimidazole phosphoribosyltransferase